MLTTTAFWTEPASRSANPACMTVWHEKRGFGVRRPGGTAVQIVLCKSYTVANLQKTSAPQKRKKN